MNDTFRITLDPVKIKLAMANKGYNVVELAKAANRSRYIMYNWINARTLSPKQAKALSDALEVEVKDLI